MGKVYLIGAGPGAPDLITVRGASILKQAGIVFHDALVNPDIVALAFGAKKVNVGKRAGVVATDQRFINRCLVEAARRYSVVVRLKGGDPLLFGRAQEEIDALRQAGIPFEVVPGVTAALAAGAELGISLTRRGVARSVVFTTARVGKGEASCDWARAAAKGDTVAIYMAKGQVREIAASLVATGFPATTPAVVVESASTAQARRLPFTLASLGQAEQKTLTGPALILVGEVFRQAQAWAEEEARSDLTAYGNTWFR